MRRCYIRRLFGEEGRMGKDNVVLEGSLKKRQ
jgi:hypothetical protein